MGRIGLIRKIQCQLRGIAIKEYSKSKSENKSYEAFTSGYNRGFKDCKKEVLRLFKIKDFRELSLIWKRLDNNLRDILVKDSSEIIPIMQSLRQNELNQIKKYNSKLKLRKEQAIKDHNRIKKLEERYTKEELIEITKELEDKNDNKN